MKLPAPFYEQVLRCLPIACVDLVVTRPDGAVLLVRRVNPPAQGEWWFPGGRVHHGERRVDAAARKLREECGLDGGPPRERGTFDLLLPLEEGTLSHGITTVFVMPVLEDQVSLDAQSSAAAWRTPGEWRRTEALHPFVRDTLDLVRGDA